jgi:hypothetical protein
VTQIWFYRYFDAMRAKANSFMVDLPIKEQRKTPNR